MAVCFDTAAPTERHTDFAEYKANRQAMPEDIGVAISYVKKIVEAFNIPMIILPGYEADDLIGTLSCKAEKAGYDVYMPHYFQRKQLTEVDTARATLTYIAKQ